MNIDGTTFWIVIGIILIIGEMITGGFFLLFISLGSFAAALAASIGQPPVVQGITCAVVAVVGVLTLRKPIQQRMLKSLGVNGDIGKEIVVDQPISPHQQARIAYQGTTWLATNLSSSPLKIGDRAIIVGMDGIVLLLRKLN